MVEAGPLHQRTRRVMHQEIGTKAGIQKYYDIEEREVQKFVARVMDDPGNLDGHLSQYAGLSCCGRWS